MVESIGGASRRVLGRVLRPGLTAAVVACAFFYVEYLTYDMPTPSVAAEQEAESPAPRPAKPEPKPIAFVARLPAKDAANPTSAAPHGETAVVFARIKPAPAASVPVDASASEREFGDAPAVVEPEAPDRAKPPVELTEAAPASGGVRIAALTPGPLPGAAPEAEAALAAPWRLNAAAFERQFGQKLVAVIIDDAGVDRARTARALRLPGPLTISFLPYAADVIRQAAEARGRGHELMLHLPMEPLSPFGYPGPDALTTTLPRAELLRRLDLHLARFDGYVGVNNHMGSRITQSRDSMLPVLESLRDRGLLFVDSRTTGATVAGALADRLGVPGGARDVFIDHDGAEGAVRARLADIERIAQRAGQAVAIGHPHDVTLEALERWLPGLAGRGLTLAPVSAIALRRLVAR